MKARGLRVGLRLLDIVTMLAAMSSPFFFPYLVTPTNLVWIMMGWVALIGSATCVSYTRGIADGLWGRTPTWLRDVEIDAFVKRMVARGRADCG